MKKLVVLGLAVVLVLGLAGMVSAFPQGLWTDTETVSAYGSTGSVDIYTIKTIHFDSNIQPGEQLVVKWWVYNRGKCPVYVYGEIIGSVTWYLEAAFSPMKPFRIAPGYSHQVALAIRMPLGTSKNAENKQFTIQVKLTAGQNQNRHQTL